MAGGGLRTHSTFLDHAGGLLIVINTQLVKMVIMMNMLNNLKPSQGQMLRVVPGSSLPTVREQKVPLVLAASLLPHPALLLLLLSCLSPVLTLPSVPLCSPAWSQPLPFLSAPLPNSTVLALSPFLPPVLLSLHHLGIQLSLPFIVSPDLKHLQPLSRNF